MPLAMAARKSAIKRSRIMNRNRTEMPSARMTKMIFLTRSMACVRSAISAHGSTAKWEDGASPRAALEARRPQFADDRANARYFIFHTGSRRPMNGRRERRVRRSDAAVAEAAFEEEILGGVLDLRDVADVPAVARVRDRSRGAAGRIEALDERHVREHAGAAVRTAVRHGLEQEPRNRTTVTLGGNLRTDDGAAVRRELPRRSGEVRSHLASALKEFRFR